MEAGLKCCGAIPRLAGKQRAPEWRAPAAQPGQPTSVRAHAHLMPVSEPHAGCEKLRMALQNFLSHYLGDEKTQNRRI